MIQRHARASTDVQSERVSRIATEVHCTKKFIKLYEEEMAHYDGEEFLRHRRIQRAKTRALYRYANPEQYPEEETIREWLRLGHLTGVPLVSIYMSKPGAPDADELYGDNPDMICRKGWASGVRPVILPELSIAAILDKGYRDFTRCSVTLGFIGDQRCNDSPYAQRVCTHEWLAKDEWRMSDDGSPKCRITYRRPMIRSALAMLRSRCERPTPEELPRHAPMRLESQAWLAAFNHLEKLRESCVTLWCLRAMRAYETALHTLEKRCSLAEFIGCVTLATRDGPPHLKYKECRTSVVSMPSGLYAYLEALDDAWDVYTSHDVYDEEGEHAEESNNLGYYAMDTRTAARRNIRHVRCMAIFRDESCETLLQDGRVGKDITVQLIGGDIDEFDTVKDWCDLLVATDCKTE